MNTEESRKARKEYLAANSHPLDTAENRQRHIHMVAMEAGRTGFDRGFMLGLFCGVIIGTLIGGIITTALLW